MTVLGFLGMRGTGDWVTDERPKNWREGILRLYPNGMAPLTAIMSKMKSRKVDDPEYNWWTKPMPTQGGTVSGLYTESSLTTAISAAGTSGATYYAKVAEAVADEFRAGHQAILRYSSDPTMDVNCEVTAVTKNGANSVLAVKLLEADDNSLVSGNNLTKCDSILIVGNINAEGASMPSAIAYKPTKLYNYTQIFRSPLSITRTAQRTKLRTGDAYKEAKREALELHSIEMEKAFIFGEKTEGTGDNGKPKRTTQGIIPCIRENVSANVLNYTLDADFSGKVWTDGGDDWLDETFELLFRYGSEEKLAFVGSGALLGINKLVKAKGYYGFTPQTKSYGIKVLEWVTPFGVVYMKTHPLFTHNAADRYSMLIIEPALLQYCYIDDTTFKPDKSSGAASIDGLEEEYLTEAGMELHFPEAFMYLTGVGVNNTLS
jgi:hypothetical protein